MINERGVDGFLSCKSSRVLDTAPGASFRVRSDETYVAVAAGWYHVMGGINDRAREKKKEGEIQPQTSIRRIV